MSIKRYIYWGLFSLIFFFISIHINYFLPVKYVLFGNQSQSKEYPISTVHGWELKIQEWDWVSSYRMGWRFPSSLFLYFEAKKPIARYSDGRYVTNDGDLFHLTGYNLPLVGLEVQVAHLQKMVNLMSAWQDWFELDQISEFSSGVVMVKTKRGDNFYLGNIEESVDLVKLNKWLGRNTAPQRCFILPNEVLSCEQL